MGKMMLQYLIDVGKVRYKGSPEDFRRSLTRLLIKSGFSKEVPLEFKGSPPFPSVNNFVEYLSGAQVQGGRSLSKDESNTGGRVDWVLYEMILYGMTKGLDSLGAQGQILIDRIGWEMLSYLVDTGRVKRSDDPLTFVKSMGDYFLKAGYMEGFEKTFEGPNADMMVLTYVNSRYHLNVLKRLRDEGSVLYSCPPCVAATAIFRKGRGYKAQYAVEYAKVGRDRVVLHHRIYYQPERFTEEEAQKVSQMMDSKNGTAGPARTKGLR